MVPNSGAGIVANFSCRRWKTWFGTVVFLLSGRSGASAFAGERQVRAEGAIFLRNVELGGGVVYGGGQFLEVRRRLNPDPEDARRLRGWKETRAGESQVEWRHGYLLEDCLSMQV